MMDAMIDMLDRDPEGTMEVVNAANRRRANALAAMTPEQKQTKLLLHSDHCDGCGKQVPLVAECAAGCCDVVIIHAVPG